MKNFTIKDTNSCGILQEPVVGRSDGPIKLSPTKNPINNIKEGEKIKYPRVDYFLNAENDRMFEFLFMAEDRQPTARREYLSIPPSDLSKFLIHEENYSCYYLDNNTQIAITKTQELKEAVLKSKTLLFKKQDTKNEN